MDGPEIADVSTWISAFDYFRLIAAAPRPGSAAPRAEQLRRLEDAYRGGPTYLLERFPGPQVLEAVRRWSRGLSGNLMGDSFSPFDESRSGFASTCWVAWAGRSGGCERPGCAAESPDVGTPF
jgi:hypothetical protein